MPARPEGGYLVTTGPHGITEASTFTCGHCQKIVMVRAKERPEDIGGLCYVCDRMICPHCVGQGCRPFEKDLEAQEARGRMLRDMGHC